MQTYRFKMEHFEYACHVSGRKMANGLPLKVRITGGIRWRYRVAMMALKFASWITGFSISVEIVSK